MSEPIQYFEEQKKLYPKAVKGKFRLAKWIIMAIAFLVYYGVPWLRYDRGEHLPNQAVLIDMTAGKGYFFFIELWPNEVIYLSAILIIAAVGLFLATSLFGRVWCGYFCFQTIWTDLFILVEQIFQGDRNARMRLDKAPMSLNKFWRKTMTHLCWLLIGITTGGAWVFYFNDAPTLWIHILQFDIPLDVLVWVVALTLSTYIMAGFAREQVCTYMCPYARFQSAMFDKNSLIIGYDPNLGEPRGHYKKGKTPEPPHETQGYCIDCKACVQVCPTGIDIRDGLQMECIACGLCIDACDDIMKKMNFTAKLIRYDTLQNFQNKVVETVKLKNFFRGRTIFYTLILLLVILGMAYNLMTREKTEIHAIHNRSPLFTILSDGTIRNGYMIKILNKNHDDRNYRLYVDGIENAKISFAGFEADNEKNLSVFADEVGTFRLFIAAPKQEKNRKKIVFVIKDKESNEMFGIESLFISGQ